MKLDRDMCQRRVGLLNELRARRALIRVALTRANSDIVDILGAVNSEVKSYNGMVALVRTLAEEVCAEIADHIDERSDRWKESERGQATQAMLEAWEEVADADDLDEVVLPDLQWGDMEGFAAKDDTGEVIKALDEAPTEATE